MSIRYSLYSIDILSRFLQNFTQNRDNRSVISKRLYLFIVPFCFIIEPRAVFLGFKIMTICDYSDFMSRYPEHLAYAEYVLSGSFGNGKRCSPVNSLVAYELSTCLYVPSYWSASFVKIWALRIFAFSALVCISIF